MLLALILAQTSAVRFRRTPLVKQLTFPNYDVPTIQIALTYPGGSTTEIRDAIVRPIEDQIAGAPDLDAIQKRRFNRDEAQRSSLDSRSRRDQNTDPVQVQGRVQRRAAA